MPTSNLICLNGQYIVLDCALGVTRGLVDQGIQLKDLTIILISHLHSDHYLELGPLLHTAWTAGLKTKVDVFGPAGLTEYWDGFLASMKADIDLRIEDEGRPDLRGLIEIHVIAEGEVLKADGISVAAMKTDHPPLVDCYAFSFQTATRRVVFSGDTAPIAEMEGFAKGADLLVHEAMLEEALSALVARVGNGSDKLTQHLRRSHTCAHDAAEIAQRAGVKKLALAHLVPADDPDFKEDDWRRAVEGHWTGPLIIGRDGLRIDL